MTLISLNELFVFKQKKIISN